MPSSGDKPSILIVDDSPATLEVLERNLRAQGYDVSTAASVASALEVLDAKPVDLVITDYKMPRTSGIELVRHVRENLTDTEVMMITGYASVPGAVEAVKSGAEEYLAKPFTDEELASAVRRALDKLAMRRAGRARGVATPRAPHGLIGESKAMLDVYNAIAKASKTAATVLVAGESGTGKELVARAIHYGSPRASAPFVPVNCGAIPEGLLESELFGHVRGAFTGATEARAGFFQTADRGTIFLDEIGETSVAMQVKLLRVIQDREVCMVGTTKTRPVDVRVIAATNKDLMSLVRKGAFREDLYYRLNVIAIDLPPLRERGDDVLVLAQHFLVKFAAEFGKPAPRLSDDALRALRGYDWPGNVRELENVVQRLVVMVDHDVVEVSDLPSLMRFSSPRAGGRADLTLAAAEAEHVRRVLAITGGNKTRAAALLGIDRKTLREKLKDVAPDRT
ncbi:MAG TPA: sigma-54 dependent transcriptional regulator [Thermoanaerobaculaceae bacterium]|nr:sigma-54 dependent transcriptional regulator [Thermoanaerobaculaceae bacterium]